MGQHIQVFAGAGRRDLELLGDKQTANAVLDQIAVYLRREMFAWPF